MLFECVSNRDVETGWSREWYNESVDTLGGKGSRHPDVVDEMRRTRHQPGSVEDRG